MIRYRTKDITKLDYSKCECGRTTARMAKLKGRTDDMLVVKGVNVFPSQIEGVLMTFKEIGSSYEIVVTREDYKDNLEVKVEVIEDSIVGDYGKLEKLAVDIRKALKTILQIDVKVRLVEHMSLKRFEGKAKRVVDLRKY
jgi:phenylacetate-CoA ligase